MASAFPQDDALDLYECQVCLTYMMDKTPRTLHCLHTFCESCIQKLLSNKTIQCPACRRVTKLEENDVQLLPVNFVLSKMKKMFDEMELVVVEKTKSDSPKSICEVCECFKPVYRCRECIQLMCGSCNNKHGIVPEFQRHHVYKIVDHNLCDKHKQNVTHVCTKCVKRLCMKCMLIDHLDHKHFFKEFSKGVSTFREELNIMKTKMEENLSEILDAKKSLQEKVAVTSEMKGNLQNALAFYNKKRDDITAKIEIIQNEHEGHSVIFNEITKSENTSRETLKALQVVISDPNVDVCSIYIPLKKQTDQALQRNRESLSMQYDTPPFDLEPVAEDIELDANDVQHLEVGCELLNIPESDIIKCVEQIACAGEHVILISALKPPHVIRLDETGKIVAKYYPKYEDEAVYGVNVYLNNIYIVQNSGITIISMYPKCLRFIAVKIKHSGKIGIISLSELIVTDPEDGTVSVYNTRSNKSEIVVQGLNNPQYVSTARTRRGMFYIITERANITVKIYDNDWNLYSSITGIDYPGQTAVTDMETLLVAEEGDFRIHRISHYTLEGALLSYIVETIQYPKGLAYQYPYMWSCDYKGRWIKCHKLMKKDKPE